MSGDDRNRKRNVRVGFWLTNEEKKKMYAKITLSGLPTWEYIYRTVLGETISIKAGRYQSERLAVELKKLRRQLELTQTEEQTRDVLQSCQALLQEVIVLTQSDKEMNE